VLLKNSAGRGPYILKTVTHPEGREAISDGKEEAKEAMTRKTTPKDKPFDPWPFRPRTGPLGTALLEPPLGWGMLGTGSRGLIGATLLQVLADHPEMTGPADAQNLANRVRERLSSGIQMELSNPAFHPFFLRDVVLKLLVAGGVREALLTQRREIDGQLDGLDKILGSTGAVTEMLPSTVE
jgi:hypothetical protein